MNVQTRFWPEHARPLILTLNENIERWRKEFNVSRLIENSCSGPIHTWSLHPHLLKEMGCNRPIIPVEHTWQDLNGGLLNPTRAWITEDLQFPPMSLSSTTIPCCFILCVPPKIPRPAYGAG